MKPLILILDSNGDRARQTKESLDQHQYHTIIATSGKDASYKITQSNFQSFILDIDSGNPDGLETLRTVRLAAPKVEIILVAETLERLAQLQLDEHELRLLGVSDLLVRPFDAKALLKSMTGKGLFGPWAEFKRGQQAPDTNGGFVSMPDSSFRGLDISEVNNRNTAIFDLYQKVLPGRYQLLIRKGEFFKLTTHPYTLYYFSQQREDYQDLISAVCAKLYKRAPQSAEVGQDKVSSEIERYVHELYSKGLSQNLVKESKQVADAILTTVTKNPNITSLLEKYQDQRPAPAKQICIVTYVSVAICQNLEWNGSRILELAALGSIFHDIGTTKLPARVLEEYAMGSKDPDMLRLYHTHPTLGAALLEDYSELPSAVRQIVLEHHEYCNGEGYPRRLSAAKIYPVAKVVSLADEFVSFQLEGQSHPVAALKEFVSRKENLLRFDSEVIKALLMSFSKDKSKLKRKAG